MKQVFVSASGVVVEEVPRPAVEAGTVLVRVRHSCISTGTELSSVKSADVPLWRKALRKPEAVVRIAEVTLASGLTAGRSLVEEKQSWMQPLGYSAAGVVEAVGAGVTGIEVGALVACAGAQCAHHAEWIRVPRNLCVPIPEGVDSAAASTVALGAIALQGVRRAEPSLGESVVVVGLGALGLLTVQMLRANGCHVLVTDPDEGRMAKAAALGAQALVRPSDGPLPQQVATLTDGVGADAVIITAATTSDEVMSTAFRMCRKRGRVVLVGDVGLHLQREDMFAKELELRISTSYGPGRYDRRFEEEGVDYPVGFVRWTETRNMTAYLGFLAEGTVSLASVVAGTYPLPAARAAYDALRAEPKPTLVLLDYGSEAPAAPEPRRIANARHHPSSRVGRLGVALVGAGGFARGVHLPNLRLLSDLYELRAIVSRRGHDAATTARSFGAAYSATDVEEVLADPSVNVVIIATRHDSHASLCARALRSGKHVLVEKPLALTRAELASVRDALDAPGKSAAPVMLTGFNRRFAPLIAPIAERVSRRKGPLVASYRMNAGWLPPDSWVFGPQGGGRNVGEACHIYDLLTHLVGERVRDVAVAALTPRSARVRRDDNFIATITFVDGSVASLTYTALGTSDYPKERLEVFCDGHVFVLDDYRDLVIAGGEPVHEHVRTQDKGHLAMLRELGRAARGEREWPSPSWQQLQAMEIAFEVEARLGSASVETA